MRLAEADPGFGLARYLAARAYLDGHEPAKRRRHSSKD
jgi:hypothetical protein